MHKEVVHIFSVRSFVIVYAKSSHSLLAQVNVDCGGSLKYHIKAQIELFVLDE
jgi:hypothetical protein